MSPSDADADRTPRITLTFNVYRDSAREFAFWMAGVQEFYSRGIHIDIRRARIAAGLRETFDAYSAHFDSWPSTLPSMEQKALDKGQFDKLRDVATSMIAAVEAEKVVAEGRR